MEHHAFFPPVTHPIASESSASFCAAAANVALLLQKANLMYLSW
jgi:hypothetical protein